MFAATRWTLTNGKKNGAAGWNYQTCSPTLEGRNLGKAAQTLYHAAAKALVDQQRHDMTYNPRNSSQFIDAGNQAGYGETTGFNGHIAKKGFGPMHMTENGVRASNV